jgi:hypothetical protein
LEEGEIRLWSWLARIRYWNLICSSLMSQWKKQGVCKNYVKCMLNMIEYINFFVSVLLYMFELREMFMAVSMENWRLNWH